MRSRFTVHAVRLVGALIAVAATLAVAAPSALAWTPEAATYGVGSQTNLPVTMSDGTVLRANVYYPTDSAGQEASGSFPVHAHADPVRQGRRLDRRQLRA